MAQETVSSLGDLVGPPLVPLPRAAPPTETLTPARAPRRRPHWIRPTADLLASLLAVPAVSLGATTVDAGAAAAVLLAWPLFLAGNGWFRRRTLPDPPSCRTRRVLRAAGGLGVACWAAAVVVDDVAAPESLFPLVAALTLGLLVIALLPFRDSGTVRVVLAGHPDDVRSAMDELATTHAYEIAEVCLSALPSEPWDDVPVRVGVGDAAVVAEQTGSDALLVLPGPGVTHVTMRRLQWHADRSGVALLVGTGLLDVAPTRVSVVQGAGLDVLLLTPAPTHGPRRVVKDVAERLLAALALVVLAPLLAAVWVLVRRESSGPGLFRQQRVGRDGASFTMLKFRTMTCTAPDDQAVLACLNDVEGGVLFKMRRDPRVTPLGAVLRRYSIDELPQLWNVVVGQMSLVGPRPALPCEVERYDLDPRRRLAVKPGITGLWQVSGRSDLSWAESVRLDMKYVDNWSLSLDVIILCHTIRAVIDHRGAY